MKHPSCAVLDIPLLILFLQAGEGVLNVDPVVVGYDIEKLIAFFHNRCSFFISAKYSSSGLVWYNKMLQNITIKYNL